MVYRMMKMTRTVNGTITANRASARFSLSYSPDQSDAITRRHLHLLIESA